MKVIDLGNGQFAKVDDADYVWLAAYKWYPLRNSKMKTSYARRNGKNRKQTFMHREILNPAPGMEVDHINGNGLDNRRKNLRVATHSQNCAWQKITPRGKRFRGVYYETRAGKWYASIRVNGKHHWLGYQATEEDAARVYDQAALEYFGPFAQLNLR